MNISDRARELVWRAERELQRQFQRIDAVEAAVQLRVLEAFQRNRVAARHFAPTTGYGYDDIGRDTLDRLFADAMGAEAALVRPQMVNGTHAIFLALAGVCRPGDHILSVTGRPYDTLEQAIGIRGDAPHSLKSLGVTFEQVPLAPDGGFDMPAILRALAAQPAQVLFVQRSRGYNWRPSLHPRQMQQAFAEFAEAAPQALIVVDNCYGEFTCATEPTQAGAHVVAGSLIKNPGGGLAPSGGYVAGRADLIDRIAQRLTVPGMGGEVGSYAGDYRPYYQGLFLAPHTTAQCVKSAVLFARVFELLELPSLPASTEERSDIIQSVRFPDADALVRFCQSIQHAAPVDSFVDPEPWDMPGYAHQVVMAAGAFVQGATTELSADGPICPPYTAYLQGALTYAHGRIAAMLAADALLPD